MRTDQAFHRFRSTQRKQEIEDILLGSTRAYNRGASVEKNAMSNTPKGSETKYSGTLVNGCTFIGTIAEHTRFAVVDVVVYRADGTLIGRYVDGRASFDTIEEAQAAVREQATERTSSAK